MKYCVTDKGIEVEFLTLFRSGEGGGRNHLDPPTGLDTGAYELLKRTENGLVIQVCPFCAP